jgi:hypothetical protein
MIFKAGWKFPGGFGEIGLNAKAFCKKQNKFSKAVSRDFVIHYVALKTKFVFFV